MPPNEGCCSQCVHQLPHGRYTCVCLSSRRCRPAGGTRPTAPCRWRPAGKVREPCRGRQSRAAAGHTSAYSMRIPPIMEMDMWESECVSCWTPGGFGSGRGGHGCSCCVCGRCMRERERRGGRGRVVLPLCETHELSIWSHFTLHRLRSEAAPAIAPVQRMCCEVQPVQ